MSASRTSGRAVWARTASSCNCLLVTSTRVPIHIQRLYVLCGSAAYDNIAKRKVAIKKIPNAWKDLRDGLRVLREIIAVQHFNHFNVSCARAVLWNSSCPFVLAQIVRLLDIIPPASGQALDDVYVRSSTLTRLLADCLIFNKAACESFLPIATCVCGADTWCSN